MTIHALCGSLLRRFPLEAGIAPHFETIDERTAGELMQEAREQVLRAGRDPGTPTGRALQTLAVALTERTLTETLEELLAQRLRLMRSRAAFGDDLEAMVAAVTAGSAPSPAPSPRSWRSARAPTASTTPTPCWPRPTRWPGIGDGLRAGPAGAHLAQRGPRGPRPAAGGVQAVLPEGRRRALQTLATKRVAALEPVVRALALEQARLVRLAESVRGLMIARRTEALLRVAFATIDAYEALRASALDYEDLIERTARLHRPGMTDWVLFKLDARIDHVLVDEAQDTSPSQWAIVERLTEEFFAGAGAKSGNRTLFVVGDEKQSIYSFQGADLANFRHEGAPDRARGMPAGRCDPRSSTALSAPSGGAGAGRRRVRAARGQGWRRRPRRGGAPRDRAGQRARLGRARRWPSPPRSAPQRSLAPARRTAGRRRARAARGAGDRPHHPRLAGPWRNAGERGQAHPRRRRPRPRGPARAASSRSWSSAGSRRRACRWPVPTGWPCATTSPSRT